MALKRPSSSEAEFIAREESKRRELEQIEREQAEAEAARALRRGYGPCGHDAKLVEESFRDILIDRCPVCNGVWLDPGELEKITHDDATVVRSVLNFFAGRSE
jgi:hypothetical protein